MTSSVTGTANFPVSHQFNVPGICSLSLNINNDVSNSVALVCYKGKRIRDLTAELF